MARALGPQRRWSGWRHEGWDGPGHRGGRGRALRWLFERMDTSPGQEKVIAEAADALRSTMRGWHDDAERMRSDVARSIRGETFDAAALEEAFARAEARLAGRARDVARAGGAGPRGARSRGSGPSWRTCSLPAGAGAGEEEPP